MKSREIPFKDRLRVAIRMNGFKTLSAFSKKSLIHEDQLQRYVCGRAKPGYETIQKFALYLPETDMRWLMTGIDKPEDSEKYSKVLDVVREVNAERRACWLICMHSQGTPADCADQILARGSVDV